MHLFGEPESKKRAKKAPEESDNVVVRLEAAFIAAHEQRWKCKPMRDYGRDRKGLKALAAQLSEEEIVRLIQVYFTSPDRQIDRGDYTFQYFFKLVSHLRLLDQRRQTDERTRENVDAARRAIGKRKP